MKIIVPIRPRSFVEYYSLVEKINNRAHFIEVWLDQLEHESFFDTMDQILPPSCKLIGCCKMDNEGGEFGGSEKDRVKILRDFLDAGGNFVDLNITTNSAENIRKIPSKNLILSFHDFYKVPENLSEIFEYMKIFSPSVYKFSVTTNNEDSLEKFLTFVKNFSSDEKIIFSTMGNLGTTGRAKIQEMQKSWAEFVAVDSLHQTAPGQRTLDSFPF